MAGPLSGELMQRLVGQGQAHDWGFLAARKVGNDEMDTRDALFRSALVVPLPVWLSGSVTLGSWAGRSTRPCESPGNSCNVTSFHREDMSRVYAALMAAGEGLGVGHMGTRVINTLRMEKGEEAID